MGCGSSTTTAPPESTGRIHTTTNDNTNYNTNTNGNTNYNTNTTTTTTYPGQYPDDNAIYGYDLYNDDNKKTGGVAGEGSSGNSTANDTTTKEAGDASNMQYDDAGFYGETETEKRDVELFDDATGTTRETTATDNDASPGNKDTSEGVATDTDVTADKTTNKDTSDDTTAATAEISADGATGDTTADRTTGDVTVTKDEDVNDATDTVNEGDRSVAATEGEGGAGDGAEPDHSSNERPAEEGGSGGGDTGGGGDPAAVVTRTSAHRERGNAGPKAEYKRNSATGLSEQYLDFRSSKPEDEKTEPRPTVAPGDLYTDTSFTLYDAIKDPSVRDLAWKRPGEITDAPQLFTGGTQRFDIGQGSAGTCWFLSTVANLADNRKLLGQVLPDDAYLIGKPEYDGVFHARFWRFGRWEDVYTDDFLPVIYNTKLWGARSATDDNEMWVALLEKAFARYHGSYNNIYGGQPGDAYLALTGGVGERIDFEDNEEKPKKLFNRIKNAIASGADVTCVVPDGNEVHGLVGGHAYSLTDTAEARGTRLLRVRNPWGKTEWTGPWSDGSSEWDGVSPSEVPQAVIDDGEFWISLNDFMRYFSQTTICSLTPDFDQDGRSDSLNFVLNVYGEWKGRNAGGFQNRLQNPRYQFTVPDNGSDAAVVVQLIQKQETRGQEMFQVRCDVYRVVGENGSSAVMELLGESTNVFTPEAQCSFRYQLRPGTYAIVPCTIEAGQERSLLIRTFSSCPLTDIRQMNDNCDVMSCKEQPTVEYHGQEHPLKFCATQFGEWRAGVNAGGQISHRDTHASNPQFLFSVDKDCIVSIHIMQECREPRQPVGMRLFPSTGSVPMDIDQIYQQYETSIANTEGAQSTFAVSWDVDATYALRAGQYVLVVHMDEPNTEKKFAVVAKSTKQIDIKGYQTG